MEVAPLANEDALSRAVARPRSFLAAVFFLHGLRAIAANAAARLGLAAECPVASAGCGELALGARELSLLRAVADDGVGTARVADLSGVRALRVVARVERAAPTTAPLDRKLSVAAAKLFAAVRAAGSGALVAAAVAHVREPIVAEERLIVGTAAFSFARFEDVFALGAYEVRLLIRAAPRRVAAVVAGLAAARGRGGGEHGERHGEQATGHELRHGPRILEQTLAPGGGFFFLAQFGSTLLSTQVLQCRASPWMRRSSLADTGQASESSTRLSWSSAAWSEPASS